MNEWICTACRKGCRLVVAKEAGEEVRVSGSRCSRGEEFGRTMMAAAADRSDPKGDAAAMAKDTRVPRERTDQPAEVCDPIRDRWDRRTGLEAVESALDMSGELRRLLKHRRRAISPAQGRKIQAVLDRARREIDALLND